MNSKLVVYVVLVLFCPIHYTQQSQLFGGSNLKLTQTLGRILSNANFDWPIIASLNKVNH